MLTDGAICVIDKVEDDTYDNKPFKKVTDKSGQTFKIKQGQGGKLQEKWPLLQPGVAIKLSVGEYNKKPFVKDFEVVKDILVAQAAEKLQTQAKDEKEQSIESQVAVKVIAELRIADKLTDTSPEYKAMLTWCRQRLNISEKQPESAPEIPQEQSSEAKERTKPKRDSSTIKTFGDLYPACAQDFHLKTRKAVWDELNVSSQEEIADTPAVCYQKIAASRR